MHILLLVAQKAGRKSLELSFDAVVFSTRQALFGDRHMSCISVPAELFTDCSFHCRCGDSGVRVALSRLDVVLQGTCVAQALYRTPFI